MQGKKFTKTNGVTVTNSFVFVLCDFYLPFFCLFSASKESLWLFLQGDNERKDSESMCVCVRVCVCEVCIGIMLQTMLYAVSAHYTEYNNQMPRFLVLYINDYVI